MIARRHLKIQRILFPFTRSLTTTQESGKKKLDIPSHFALMEPSILTHEMMASFKANIKRATHVDVIVIGSGLAGLSCAYELTKQPHIQVALIEKNPAPGGSHWQTQIFPSCVIRKPAQHILDEIGVSYVARKQYVTVPHIATLTSTLASKVLSAKNVVFLNSMEVKDVILYNGSVDGVWANLTSEKTHSCSTSEPFIFHSSVVVSACGSVTWGGQPGGRERYFTGDYFAPKGFDLNKGEDEIVYHTREVADRLIVAGSEVACVDGCHLPGPTNGSMIVSGIKAASLAADIVTKRIPEQKAARKAALETAGHFIGQSPEDYLPL